MEILSFFGRDLESGAGFREPFLRPLGGAAGRPGGEGGGAGRARPGAGLWPRRRRPLPHCRRVRGQRAHPVAHERPASAAGAAC